MEGFWLIKKIEISIPSVSSFLKYLILVFIFLPWACLSVPKFDLISLVKKALTFLFGPINCECDCPNPIPSQKTPY